MADMKRRGRPPIGELIEMRVRTDTLQRLTIWAKVLGVPRAVLIRRILEQAVELAPLDNEFPGGV